MKVKEAVKIGGKMFIHTYSDKGMRLERDGEFYDDAFDLEELGREYVETEIPIETADL